MHKENYSIAFEHSLTEVFRLYTEYCLVCWETWVAWSLILMSWPSLSRDLPQLWSLSLPLEQPIKILSWKLCIISYSSHSHFRRPKDTMIWFLWQWAHLLASISTSITFILAVTENLMRRNSKEDMLIWAPSAYLLGVGWEEWQLISMAAGARSAYYLSQQTRKAGTDEWWPSSGFLFFSLFLLSLLHSRLSAHRTVGRFHPYSGWNLPLS